VKRLTFSSEFRGGRDSERAPCHSDGREKGKVGSLACLTTSYRKLYGWKKGGGTKTVSAYAGRDHFPNWLGIDVSTREKGKNLRGDLQGYRGKRGCAFPKRRTEI